MGDFLLPMAFFFVIVVIIGLSVWLALTFLRKRPPSPNRSDGGALSPPRPTAGGREILQVRLNAQGIWEVLVYGERYTTLDAVPDKQTQDQVVDAVKILAAFSRGYIQKQREAPAPPPTEAPKVVASDVPLSALTRPREQELRRPSAPPMLMPEINLAKEIGEILEEMKLRSPALRDRSIRLQNSPGGGVIFVIDGVSHTSVDEIADLEVQALIRAATKEWERR